ncbi:methyltransferase family protein [Litorimonas taeanensis]|uniref:Methyltransferase family protein n=1 Tax=Litorimonas taeanensis TaxID=568099 RepID=A0A420WF11_9PROT|nr:methyltransferase domain-containing protein [Litorimonas taeanensis]RKQ69574.1 methyltransferase family protein [Litorimonas taeanensis]
MMQREVPQIFDAHAQGLARVRAQRRMAKTGPSFLLERCTQDAASRISDINRQFTRGVLLCDVDMREKLFAELPNNRRPNTMEWYQDADSLSGDYDLIISLLGLQSINDLPGNLLQIRNALLPDGLFMGSLFGGDSLLHLRQTFYQIDQALFGGATARIYPMINHEQAAALLGQAGLNLPVIDKDRVNVNYSKIQTLINDLRDLGLTNTLIARHKSRLPKSSISLIEAAYPKSATGKFQVLFEILWMTGWSPHDSQQKPLKPGSAKKGLAESLREIRDKKP